MSESMAIVVSIIGTIATVAGALISVIESNTFDWIISFGALVFSYALLVFYYKLQQKEEEKSEERAEKLKNDVTSETEVTTTTPDGTTITTKQEEVNAVTLMTNNLNDMKNYYTWSQQQARGAFIVAIVMTAVGFGLIVFAVVLVGVLGKPLEVAIIPTIGGVITELLAATVMIVYRNSMVQLNHYHQALHEDERFLSGINLIEKFADKKLRDEMLQKLIQSEIDLNLAEVGKNPDEEEKKEKEEKSDENADKKEKEEPKEGQKDESEDSA